MHLVSSSPAYLLRILLHYIRRLQYHNTSSGPCCYCNVCPMRCQTKPTIISAAAVDATEDCWKRETAWNGIKNQASPSQRTTHALLQQALETMQGITERQRKQRRIPPTSIWRSSSQSKGRSFCSTTRPPVENFQEFGVNCSKSAPAHLRNKVANTPTDNHSIFCRLQGFGLRPAVTFIVFQFFYIEILFAFFSSCRRRVRLSKNRVVYSRKISDSTKEIAFLQQSDVCFPNIAFDAPAYEMGKKGLWLPFFACLLSTFPSANQDSIQYLTIQNSIFLLRLLSFVPCHASELVRHLPLCQIGLEKK